MIFSYSHYFVNTIFGGLGFPIRTPKAYVRVDFWYPIKTPKAYYILLLWAQASRLFDCLPDCLSVAVGTIEPIRGWSGIKLRYISSAS